MCCPAYQTCLSCAGRYLLGVSGVSSRVDRQGLGESGGLAATWQISVSVDTCLGESVFFFYPRRPIAKCIRQLRGLTRGSPGILGAVKEKVNLDMMC